MIPRDSSIFGQQILNPLLIVGMWRKNCCLIKKNVNTECLLKLRRNRNCNQNFTNKVYKKRFILTAKTIEELVNFRRTLRIYYNIILVLCNIFTRINTLYKNVCIKIITKIFGYRIHGQIVFSTSV